jgi:hypothetical protein
MWLEGIHRRLHVEVECIHWKKGTCCSIFPYKCGVETFVFPAWMWKDSSYSDYTSVELTDSILDHDTDLGTLHEKKKGNSHEVINAELNKGDVVAMENGM